MRLVSLCVLAIAFVFAAGLPALAQSSDAPSSGGLTVCCGATFGYVGGSGSVSGSIRGPGGDGGSPSRAEVARPAATAGPTAVLGGLVRPASLPAVAPTVTTTAAHRNVVPWVLAVLVLLGSVFVYRRFPRTA